MIISDINVYESGKGVKVFQGEKAQAENGIVHDTLVGYTP